MLGQNGKEIPIYANHLIKMAASVKFGYIVQTLYQKSVQPKAIKFRDVFENLSMQNSNLKL